MVLLWFYDLVILCCLDFDCVSVTLSFWLHSGRNINPMLSLQAVCVCVHSLCVFAHLVFLRGACKSGKFLAQLVPAVSIPCVRVCVRAHLCVWVWGELKLCHDAATASDQVKPVTRHQMSEHNLCLGPSKNSCHVRWWGGNIRIAR